MKLSEAIRAGAARTEQVFGTFFNDDGTRTGACALGAAWVAVDGCSVMTLSPTKMTREFPLLKKRGGCPVDHCFVGSDLFSLIPHLNDDHEWSRRDIADWVETFEEDSIPVYVGVPAEKSADMALAPEEAPV